MSERRSCSRTSHARRPKLRRLDSICNCPGTHDKIYDAARAEGVPSAELARRYGDAYIADTEGNTIGLWQNA